MSFAVSSATSGLAGPLNAFTVCLPLMAEYTMLEDIFVKSYARGYVINQGQAARALLNAIPSHAVKNGVRQLRSKLPIIDALLLRIPYYSIHLFPFSMYG